MKRGSKRARPAPARSTHFDDRGCARMVDVGAKPATAREAVAHGRVALSREALEAVVEGRAEKGDVLGVARIAAIQAAKRTSEWIPLCHPLPLDALEIDFETSAHSIEIEARARTTAKTGVEMEALVAVSAAALAIYDMLKSVDRAIVIGDVRLVRKSGGRSGSYKRQGS